MRKKLFAVLLVVFLFLLLSSKGVYASFASIKVELVWSELKIEGNLEPIPGTGQTSVYAAAANLKGEYSGDKKDGALEDTLEIFAKISDAESVAYAYDAAIGIGTRTYPYGWYTPETKGVAYRNVRFKADPGNVSISIPYLISYEVSASQLPNSFATAFGSVLLLFEGYGKRESDQYGLVITAYPGETWLREVTGTLKIDGFYVESSGEYLLSIEANGGASAHSPVPLPGAFILFGSGLLALRVVVPAMRKKAKIG